MQRRSLPEALALHVSTLLRYCNLSVVVSYNIHARKIALFSWWKVQQWTHNIKLFWDILPVQQDNQQCVSYYHRSDIECSSHCRPHGKGDPHLHTISVRVQRGIKKHKLDGFDGMVLRQSKITYSFISPLANHGWYAPPSWILETCPSILSPSRRSSMPQPTLLIKKSMRPFFGDDVFPPYSGDIQQAPPVRLYRER